MKKKVVISQSTVSAGQLEDLFRMIKDGTIGGEEMRAFLENPKKFFKGGPTIVRAINILGQGKVVTAEQASKSWGLETPKSATIRYGEETLRECAKENQSGQSDWRLVFINGLSLREQREIRGTDKTKQSCFCNNDWWLKSCEDGWAKKNPQPGYYLINFRGQFANMNWHAQEKAIVELGPGFERCHEAIFAEAILTIYTVNNGERIAENWWHWGISATSYGHRVFVGLFDSGGLGVDLTWHDHSGGLLRVCVSQKFSS